ncbi:two-component system sensor histidine kinase YesM [Paenibacillus phyllosphaerae]|uniref:Two-component system sensor histidine kinase YesM n=1 Tax=Paenibacillus phyllosphaerae TaxID=274593 RepID=A0A7W5AZQ6_9BACL|nr:histidine kinase [Paenibacillus phyllosphaerae]MBB3111754.1 two-component system sensor histidine kinase YesM [Paenibacillus phyllosphaerae]
MLKLIRHRVFVKLLAGFLIIGIPVETIGLAVTWYGAKIVLEKTNQSMEEKMFFFASFLEEELSNVNQMMVSLSMDTDLAEYALQRNSEFSYPNVITFDLLMSKLKILQFSSDYITDVFMILPEPGEVASVIDGFNHIQEKERAYLGELQKSTTNRFLYGDKLVYFSAGHDFVLGVEISQSQIVESLRIHQGNPEYHVYVKDRLQNTLLSPQSLSVEEKGTVARIESGADHASDLVVQETQSKDQLFTIGFYASKAQVLGAFYSLQQWFWALSCLIVVIIIAFSLFINHQIQTPLALLVRSMKEVERGNYGGRLALRKNDEFGYVYKQFNRMSDQLQNLIQEVLEKKIQYQRAQLRNLQSQINPHFLYNCFYNGYRMAKSGQVENVAKLFKFLGDYFRFVTYSSDKDVTLAEEVKYTLNYLEIQKIRYPSRLSFSIDCPMDVSDYQVPGLILQPLVENALIHGLEQQEGQTHIHIRMMDDDDQLRVEVSDNGPGIKEGDLDHIRKLLEETENETEHFGLWNIKWRLQYRFGEEASLSIGPRLDGTGTLVSFRFPKSLSKRGE